MGKRICIGNIRVLDIDNPYKEGVVLIKDVEFYYDIFRQMVCLKNGVNISSKSRAMDDHEFLRQSNQTPCNLKYMEEIDSYIVSNQEFNKRIKEMKKVKRKVKKQF